MYRGHIPKTPVALFGTHNSEWTKQIQELIEEVLPEDLQPQLKSYTQNKDESVEKAGRRIAEQMDSLAQSDKPASRTSIDAMVNEDVLKQLKPEATKQEIIDLIARGGVEKTLFANAAALLTSMEKYIPFVAALAHDTSNTKLTIDLGPYAEAQNIGGLKTKIDTLVSQVKDEDPPLAEQLVTLKESLVSVNSYSENSKRKVDIVLKGRAKNFVINVLLDLHTSPRIETNNLLTEVSQLNRPRSSHATRKQLTNS